MIVGARSSRARSSLGRFLLFVSAAGAGTAQQTASATARQSPGAAAEWVVCDGWDLAIVQSPFIWPARGDLPVQENKWVSAARWSRIGQAVRACERADGESVRACR